MVALRVRAPTLATGCRAGPATAEPGARPDQLSRSNKLTITQQKDPPARPAGRPTKDLSAGLAGARHVPNAVVRAARSDPAILAAGALLLLGLCLLYTYPLALNLGSAFAYNAGDTAPVTWQLTSNWHAFLHDPAALTSPTSSFRCRVRFFIYLLLPPTLLFGPIFALSGNPVLASNAVTLATLWLNGLLTGLLAWRWTGRRPAAAAGAVIGALSPLVLQRLPTRR